MIKIMKNNIILIFLAFFLSACATAKVAAPIEYHHNDKNFSRSSESTMPVIYGNDDIIENVNIEDYYEEDSELITPAIVNDDENYIMPNRIIKSSDKISENIETIIQDEPKKKIQEIEFDYIKPVNGKVIVKFGQRTKHGINKGINIAAPEGSQVISSASGKVIYADYDAIFGNLVIVKSDINNTIISYSHLKNVQVKKGARIKQSEIIGYVGISGKVNRPQLHFAIREGKKALDPLMLIQY